MAEAQNSTNEATDNLVEDQPSSRTVPQTEIPDTPADMPAGDKGEGDEQGKEMDSEDSQESPDEGDLEDSKHEILDPEQLEERLGEARKAVIVSRYEDAMQLLPSCLATITDKEGELSVKLAEPHYLYGKSMFECARINTGVLGEGVLKDKHTHSKGEESSDDNVETTDEVTETEPNNFEVAWENLEVSRVICSKALELNSSDIEVANILLEVLTCLAELQIETGCYEKAAADFEECLQLLGKYPDISTLKLVGATHFSIGMALSLAGDYQLAVEALTRSLDALTKLLGESEGSEASSLQELIDDIKPRLAEAIDQTREKIEQMKQGSESDKPTNSSNGDKDAKVILKPVSIDLESVKVNDISHLVRKKRSVEEVTSGPVGEATSPKKAKKEQEVNALNP
ncbi:Nuclear autoantigenic sperm protein [Oopsacas minuta]|uniref:Nuclear autoantigenic sperm protein n=1 Tax=Oopsacas minuta TaxID=111878 RepID=A0AAV7JCU8_9METZ|nr:Nuclear autoantigenic sperm protein [Oopsacas minuta]